MTIDRVGQLTLDEVDLWNLYLDAVEEAQLIAREKGSKK